MNTPILQKTVLLLLCTALLLPLFSLASFCIPNSRAQVAGPAGTGQIRTEAEEKSVSAGNDVSSNPGNGTSSNPGNGTSSNPGNGTSSNPGNGTSSNPGNDVSSNHGNGTSSDAGNGGAAAEGENAEGGRVAGVSDDRSGSVFWGVVIALLIAGAVIAGIVLMVPKKDEN